MTKDEALKMALKALRIAQMELASSREDAEEFGDEGIWDEYDYAMNAIRQALAEHEQEPVDLLKQSEREGWRYANECELEIKRLRAEKREWVGLTDEEIQEMANDFEEGYVFLYRSFAAAIEAKLKEKNT